jgi:predicted Co/Zn/Cd cation transporter (cation efflux family)
MDTVEEQRLLKLSIAVTLALGSIGVIIGVLIASQSIIFDSFYSLIDVAMTAVALLVSRLVARGDTRRFQYGFWHLEPMVAALSATVLAASCSYAFLSAAMSLTLGGHTIAFGPGAVYAAASGLVCLLMAFYVHKHAARLNSELLRLDARVFLIGGILSIGLLVSFGIGLSLDDSRHASILPYIDPVVLMVITACVVPLPLATVWRAAQEIFQIAPTQLDETVRAAADAIVRRHGFLACKTHVAKAGRAHFIEVNMVVPADFRIAGVADLDRIRQEMSDALGETPDQRWLTIVFTADPKWAGLEPQQGSG